MVPQELASTWESPVVHMLDQVVVVAKDLSVRKVLQQESLTLAMVVVLQRSLLMVLACQNLVVPVALVVSHWKLLA